MPEAILRALRGVRPFGHVGPTAEPSGGTPIPSSDRPASGDGALRDLPRPREGDVTGAEVGHLRLAFLGDPQSLHLLRWLVQFADRGHDVHLILPAHEPSDDRLDPRIAVDRFRAWPALRPRALRRILAAMALHRLLVRLRPDVLHAHRLDRHGLGAWLAAFHPYVITVWGSDVLIVVRQARTLRLAAWLALRGADVVTGGSQQLVRAAIAAGARPGRTRFIHFGVDTSRFTPDGDPSALRARLGLDGRRVVLSNRSIAPIYRQWVVVEALAALPSDVVALLTLQAASAAEVARVEARAAELGLTERVRIVPTLPEADLPDLYRLSDVVVSVPTSDGGPLTVVEALASGRPVVATDLPSVREWLADLDPESLVPVDDPRATAEAIGRVLARTPDDRERRAALGRAAVEERASVARNMSEMEDVYRELAARRRPGRSSERGAAPSPASKPPR